MEEVNKNKTLNSGWEMATRLPAPYTQFPFICCKKWRFSPHFFFFKLFQLWHPTVGCLFQSKPFFFYRFGLSFAHQTAKIWSFGWKLHRLSDCEREMPFLSTLGSKWIPAMSWVTNIPISPLIGVLLFALHLYSLPSRLKTIDMRIFSHEYFD